MTDQEIFDSNKQHLEGFINHIKNIVSQTERLLLIDSDQNEFDFINFTFRNRKFQLRANRGKTTYSTFEIELSTSVYNRYDLRKIDAFDYYLRDNIILKEYLLNHPFQITNTAIQPTTSITPVTYFWALGIFIQHNP